MDEIDGKTPDPRQVIRNAEHAVMTGDLGRAVRSFRVAAEAHLARGQARPALDVVQRALTLKDEPFLHALGADACVALGRKRDAVAYLEAARVGYTERRHLAPLDAVLRRLIGLAPGHAEAFAQLGRSSLRAGQTEFGRKCLERAILLYRRKGDTAQVEALERRLSAYLPKQVGQLVKAERVVSAAPRLRAPPSTPGASPGATSAPENLPAPLGAAPSSEATRAERGPTTRPNTAPLAPEPASAPTDLGLALAAPVAVASGATLAPSAAAEEDDDLEASSLDEVLAALDHED